MKKKGKVPQGGASGGVRKPRGARYPESPWENFRPFSNIEKREGLSAPILLTPTVRRSFFFFKCDMQGERRKRVIRFILSLGKKTQPFFFFPRHKRKNLSQTAKKTTLWENRTSRRVAPNSNLPSLLSLKLPPSFLSVSTV